MSLMAQGDLWRKCRAGILSLLSGFVLVLAPSTVDASGYHPDLDETLEQASWIVVHRVVSTHRPRDVLLDCPTDKTLGRVYVIQVVRSFRGPFKKGDRLLLWDNLHFSTADYAIDTNGLNLSFLAPPGTMRKVRRAGFGKGPTRTEVRSIRTYGGKARAKDTRLKVGVVFRNKIARPGDGRRHGLRDWVRLLEMTRVGRRAIDVSQARKALRGRGDRWFHFYVLTHWPGTPTVDDGRAILALLRKQVKVLLVASSAHRLLRKHHLPQRHEALARLLTRGGNAARLASIRTLGKAERRAARDLLWAWVQRDAKDAQGAIRALAAGFAGFFADKLRGRKLPFWLIVPALKALSKTPAELRQPAYSKDVTEAGDADVGALGRLVKGELEPAIRVMGHREGRLAPFAPLLVPYVAAMKPAARAVAVALMRTWGFDVQHRGKKITLGRRRARPPLLLKIRAVPGEPKRIEMVEELTRPTKLCARSVWRVRVTRNGKTVASRDETVAAFEATKTARGCVKVAEGIVRRDVIDLAPLLAGLQESGTFDVEVDLLHQHGGTEHGLDGWTGRVFAPPLPIIHDAPTPRLSLREPKDDGMAQERPSPKRFRKGCGCGAAPGRNSSPPLGALLVLVFLTLICVKKLNLTGTPQSR